jgi:hypothetical protein
MQILEAPARRLAAFLALSAFLILSAASVSAEPELNDQFGAAADLGTLLASPRVILLHSDERDGVEKISAMRKAVAGAAEGALVPVVCVADLSALPFFVPRSAVAGSVKKDVPDFRLFLDWKGALGGRLKLPEGSVARAYADGRQLAELRADAAPAAFAALVAAAASGRAP